MAILLDTGAIVALLDADDPHHKSVDRFLESVREPLFVPLIVLPEVSYLVNKYLGPEVERSFLRGVLRGEVTLEWGQPGDLARAVEILGQRPDFGIVDAMIMAIAERLKIKRIATLDRRHFGRFKPAHCTAFELVP